MTVAEQTEHIERVNAMPPEEMLKWAFEEYGQRAAIVTSFQDTGCVMIDMAHRAGVQPRVITIDTLRLPQETYDLMDQIEERYGVTVERFKPDPDRVEKMIDRHGEYLFFDSKEKQEYCCRIRKVESNDRALATLDVWFTGLRRDQSKGRQETEKARYVRAPEDPDRRILKVSPLADWDRDRVWDYIRVFGVPYNKLYDQGYTSLGCVICTTPTRPGEDARAGRWRWFNAKNAAMNADADKECGIHVEGSGI
jgi:phosphoadenosine phosphosulfate reductase